MDTGDEGKSKEARENKRAARASNRIVILILMGIFVSQVDY